MNFLGEHHSPTRSPNTEAVAPVSSRAGMLWPATLTVLKCVMSTLAACCRAANGQQLSMGSSLLGRGPFCAFCPMLQTSILSMLRAACSKAVDVESWLCSCIPRLRQAFRGRFELCGDNWSVHWPACGFVHCCRPGCDESSRTYSWRVLIGWVRVGADGASGW